MARKSLSKKIRFEVFKRDNFTCQYCGRKSPDVVLEVDHIQPIACEGTNDIMNLITSCFDCNRGKGKKELSDDAEIKIQRMELEQLNIKREQMKMMIQWREELKKLTDVQVNAIEELFKNTTGYHLTDHGRKTCTKWIKEFGFEAVYTNTEYSIDRYYEGDSKSASNAWHKIGGICYNKKKQESDRNGNI